MINSSSFTHQKLGVSSSRTVIYFKKVAPSQILLLLQLKFNRAKKQTQSPKDHDIHFLLNTVNSWPDWFKSILWVYSECRTTHTYITVLYLKSAALYRLGLTEKENYFLKRWDSLSLCIVRDLYSVHLDNGPSVSSKYLLIKKNVI